MVHYWEPIQGLLPVGGQPFPSGSNTPVSSQSPRTPRNGSAPSPKPRGPIADFKSQDVFAKALEAARKDAGWEKGAWPTNALRKTFISCHFESHGSIDETAKQAGTSVGIIHRHYRKLIKKKVADELWKLLPAEAEADNVTAFAKS